VPSWVAEILVGCREALRPLIIIEGGISLHALFGLMIESDESNFG
jgi:hypothetical protein